MSNIIKVNFKDKKSSTKSTVLALFAKMILVYLTIIAVIIIGVICLSF